MIKKTSTQLKKELDKWFSLYIRQLYSDENGYGNCYTCGKHVHYKEAHCGHFISRNILITRWAENNCRLQCVGCNIFGNGKVLDFQDNLVKEIGVKAVEKMKASRHQVCKMSTADYLEKVSYYKQKVGELSTD